MLHKPALYQGTTGIPSNLETVAAMETKESCPEHQHRRDVGGIECEQLSGPQPSNLANGNLFPVQSQLFAELPGICAEHNGHLPQRSAGGRLHAA